MWRMRPRRYVVRACHQLCKLFAGSTSPANRLERLNLNIYSRSPSSIAERCLTFLALTCSAVDCRGDFILLANGLTLGSPRLRDSPTSFRLPMEHQLFAAQRPGLPPTTSTGRITEAPPSPLQLWNYVDGPHTTRASNKCDDAVAKRSNGPGPRPLVFFAFSQTGCSAA
jgi:hypothetical protein